jgi:hypothetical protein
MLWEPSVCDLGCAKVSVDGPLLVLLVGTLGLDRLGGWHASDGRHVVGIAVKVCLRWCRSSTTKFPALVERDSGKWPFAYCRQVVVRVWKETEARAARRGNRGAALSGAELELGVGEDESGVAKGETGR